MQTHIKASAILVLGILSGCSMDRDSDTQADKPTAATSMQEQRITDVTAAQAVELIATNKDVVVLDIRTPAEFAAGHIAGAININYAGDNRDEQLGALDKSKTYVMH
ncbi:MAG: 3-mercaptopyruvate sulfurtransferase SseA [Planctomycetota bacterium]|jgi:3-mercaptopyruvate sulfurtransferase SseA